MELEEAIDRSRRGDLSAYEIVVRECQGALTAFIAAFSPDRDQVDEIARRAFVWAYEHLDQYQPGARFRA
jgi:DNA-directed RNA polymerase specialized sigma24 family protein